MATIDKQRRQAKSGAAVRVALDKKSTPKRHVLTLNGTELFVTPALDWGMVWVDGFALYVNQETYATLRGYRPALLSFWASFGRDPSPGLKFIGLDVGWWVEACRVESRFTGDDVVRGKDRLTILEEAMQELLTSAPDFANGQADREHLNMFFQRVSFLRGELEDTESRLEYVRALMDLCDVATGGL